MEMFKTKECMYISTERYYLSFGKKDALKTMIQAPISLASSVIHAAATVTGICVFNKSFPTLHFMLLLHDSKAEKNHGDLAVLLKRSSMFL